MVQIDRVASTLAARGAWVIPTLATSRAILDTFDHPDGAFALPEAVYFQHPLERAVWAFIIDNLYRPVPAPARVALRDDFERFQRPLTRALHEKGGKLLAGSDTIIPGLVPGFGLHRELAELVRAGSRPTRRSVRPRRGRSSTWASWTAPARSRSASGRT